jgi:hypothetical protein
MVPIRAEAGTGWGMFSGSGFRFLSVGGFTLGPCGAEYAYWFWCHAVLRRPALVDLIPLQRPRRCPEDNLTLGSGSAPFLNINLVRDKAPPLSRTSTALGMCLPRGRRESIQMLLFPSKCVSAL